MRCSCCGGDIEQGQSECKYCGQSVEDSIVAYEGLKEWSKKNSAQIDSVFGFKTDYNSMSTPKLQGYFDRIEKRLQKFEQDNCYTQEQYRSIMDYVLRVGEALQDRHPIRRYDNVQPPKCSTTSECIRQVLSWEKPEIYMAGAKIRSSVERQLKEYYRCVIARENNNWCTLFYSVLGNHKAAKKCAEYHAILNYFVHSSTINDDAIRRCCFKEGVKDAKDLLLKILAYYKNKNMIYEHFSQL